MIRTPPMVEFRELQALNEVSEVSHSRHSLWHAAAATVALACAPSCVAHAADLDCLPLDSQGDPFALADPVGATRLTVTTEIDDTDHAGVKSRHWLWVDPKTHAGVRCIYKTGDTKIPFVPAHTSSINDHFSANVRRHESGGTRVTLAGATESRLLKYRNFGRPVPIKYEFDLVLSPGGDVKGHGRHKKFPRYTVKVGGQVAYNAPHEPGRTIAHISELLKEEPIPIEVSHRGHPPAKEEAPSRFGRLPRLSQSNVALAPERDQNQPNADPEPRGTPQRDDHAQPQREKSTQPTQPALVETRTPAASAPELGQHRDARRNAQTAFRTVDEARRAALDAATGSRDLVEQAIGDFKPKEVDEDFLIPIQPDANRDRQESVE